MDLLPWNNLQPAIKQIPSTKKFYGKYLYKITYYPIHGCHCIPVSSTPASLQSAVSRLKKNYLSNLEKLNILYNAYRDRGSQFRFRFEGSTVSIFSDSEHELYELANCKLIDIKDSLKSVTRVANDRDLEILESGKIIMRTDLGFKFKVTLKQGFWNNSEKQHLVNYLTNLGNEIKISTFLLRSMQTNYKYLTSVYFYVNDPRIVDIIALVAPNMVKRIQEIVVR